MRIRLEDEFASVAVALKFCNRPDVDPLLDAAGNKKAAERPMTRLLTEKRPPNLCVICEALLNYRHLAGI